MNRNREFASCTGTYRGKRITVLSSGIGTDNIDIVMNELDALVNIDFNSKTEKKKKKSLNIIRIGTSGTINKDIPLKSAVISEFSLGFDSLMHFYNFREDEEESQLLEEIEKTLDIPPGITRPYLVKADSTLIDMLGLDFFKGITITAPGFYGPQGRQLRLRPFLPDLNEKMMRFKKKQLQITNFEMESSALYGLSKMMGHKACTVCLIIANRPRGQFLNNYKPAMEELAGKILQRLSF